MAKTMFDNLKSIVANTLTDSIKMIDISELHESQDNFFQISRIEELADTILGQGGVKDNLVVRPLEAGGYEIISGHRRRAAVQLLIDRGENVSHVLPCLIQEYADEDSKMLDIILMNVSARQLSDAELWKSYEKIDAILKEKKSSGEKFGRVRETLADMLGVSPAQIGKMQNVEKNAVPAIKEAVEKGNISISTANEIAKLDEDTQEKLAEADLHSIQHKDVKKLANAPKSEKKSDKPLKTAPVIEDHEEEHTDEAEVISEETSDIIINDNGSSMDEVSSQVDNLSIDEFVHKHCGILYNMCDDYIDYLCDDADEKEIQIIESFKKLLLTM